MNTEFDGDREKRLMELFDAYRDACAVPDASANFMPALWQKIESRQGIPLIFGRIARAFATAALALASILAVAVALEKPGNQAFYNGTYVEALAASQSIENAPYDEPVRLDAVADTVDTHQ